MGFGWHWSLSLSASRVSLALPFLLIYLHQVSSSHLDASKSDFTYASLRTWVCPGHSTFQPTPDGTSLPVSYTKSPWHLSSLPRHCCVYTLCPSSPPSLLHSILLFLLFLPQPPHILLLCTALRYRHFTVSLL